MSYDDELKYLADLIKKGWISNGFRDSIVDISKSVITNKKDWSIISKTGMRAYIYGISNSVVSVRIDATDPMLKNALIEGIECILGDNAKLNGCELGYTRIRWKKMTNETIDVSFYPPKTDPNPIKTVSWDELKNKEHYGDEGYFCLICHTLKPSNTPDRECPYCRHTMAEVNYNLFFNCEDCNIGYYIIDCRWHPIPCAFRCNSCGGGNGKADAKHVKPDRIMVMDAVYDFKSCFNHHLIRDYVATITAIEAMRNIDKEQLKRIYRESLVYEKMAEYPDDENAETYRLYRDVVRELVWSHSGMNYIATDRIRPSIPGGHVIRNHEELRKLLNR